MMKRKRKKIRIKFKLNKRGVIILVALLFLVSTGTTFLIMQSVKRNKAPDDTTVSIGDITPEPSPIIDGTEVENDGDTENDDVDITPSPTPVQKASNFDFPEEGRRPIAVMIDNEGSEVLPQGGLAQAQVVYEAITEYGATRYMALFWDNLPDYIGPVRSSRHYFLDYAMEYDSIYTHIGWSDYAYRDLDLFGIDNIDGVMEDVYGVFWDLTTDKSNYHDSYTNRERLDKYIKKALYSLETEKKLPLTYNSEDLVNIKGDKAEEVFIKYSVYSTCGYYYDEVERNYKRTRLGEFHIDRNTNDTIRTKNIIILFVDNNLIEGDKYGRQQLHTTGGGNGYYISNGIKQDITWIKTFRSSQVKYLDADKKELVLNPGQTWIQIVSPKAEVRVH